MIERYTTPEMRDLWSEEGKYRAWQEVEIAICEGLAHYGYIPTDAPSIIRERARFDGQRIAELEQETRHDVMAFVRNLAENVGEAGRWIHFGVTSYDVVDTALALRLKKSVELILAECDALQTEIRRLALEHLHTPMIGRTHGVHAEPITFGFKLLGWYAEMERHIQRLERLLPEISVGKVSGAVGIHANVDPRVEEYVCAKLGLTPDPASTQIVARDRHASLLCAFAVLAASLEKFATEIRNLQRTEILEVQEPFAQGQTGSSAMPHKRNPWNCETVSGLARVVRANALAMLESVATWHERDLTNSSVERIVIPDTCTLIHWMLRKFTSILRGLVVLPENMRRNLELLGGLPYSEHVMLALVRKGLAREHAYKLVQRNAARVWDERIAFVDALLSDPEVRRYLNEDEIRQCLSLEHHLRHLDTTVQRVLGEE
ncbi:MAG: adenylosuccinate lyase [Armatimonadetes bacterium JP3_11]|jgi:adenylosuccinate lyase|nr:MAG: adenylosuccinate lyase [Armatimonadetes bacterium CP1_7O]OYT75885.1 MAG: adenylosuccinate lyase [Armatimonadetes bacterium JP3_11]RMH07348.1 MAG: adenylosuccinate lyase [Armatimonadota bacterium]